MKKILVVIDMQNDFIDKNVLGNDECCSVVDKVREKIINTDANIVIATKDTHNDNYLDTLEGKNLPVVHCIKDTSGWEIESSIKEVLNEKKAAVIEKLTFGSFDLVNEIRKNIDNNEDIIIELCGVCTGICVISNALILRAAFPNTEIIVDQNCCACVTKQSHKNALDAMGLCQIKIV